MRDGEEHGVHKKRQLYKLPTALHPTALLSTALLLQALKKQLWACRSRSNQCSARPTQSSRGSGARPCRFWRFVEPPDA